MEKEKVKLFLGTFLCLGTKTWDSQDDDAIAQSQVENSKIENKIYSMYLEGKDIDEDLN